MKTTPQRDKRCRLSLECASSFKQSLEEHGDELKQWALIGTLRKAVSRSRA